MFENTSRTLEQNGKHRQYVQLQKLNGKITSLAPSGNQRHWLSSFQRKVISLFFLKLRMNLLGLILTGYPSDVESVMGVHVSHLFKSASIK